MTGVLRSVDTLAAQGLGQDDPITGGIISPLQFSTTFIRDADNGYTRGRIYGRADNPTYDAPQKTIAALEGGTDCLLFASGMAAATAVFLALKPGDHVIAPNVMYWALRRWLRSSAAEWGLTVEFVDTTCLNAISRSIRPGKTRLVWIETPANPTWCVTDIAEVVKIAHAGGAVLAVDSTAATPLLTRPLALGADIVMHSATKYLNGHGDVVAGALVSNADSSIWRRIKETRGAAGAILGTMEAWLLMRGLRTLPLRVERACRSAAKIADHFANDARVERVYYPGLASDPGHAIARRQMVGGYGGMLSIEIAGGAPAAIRAAARIKVWKRATSFGGLESLLEHRASVEGPDSPAPPGLLRFSVGAEDVRELIEDLDQALTTA